MYGERRGGDVADRRVQIRFGKNEALYRSVNDSIAELSKSLGDGLDLHCEWLCECADPNCTTRVAVTASEYEAVRANARTFMVYPGHVAPRVEHVVRGNERFTVVEKLGVRAEVAEATHIR